MQSSECSKNKSSKSAVKAHYKEEILAVRREFLFPYGVLNGLHLVEVDQYEKLILSRGTFIKRSLVEENPNFKQIIPYLVFNYKDKYFLTQRKPTANETRLKNKYSLGIGGHIRKEDTTGKTLTDWAIREFKEEVSYKGTFTIETLGLLNDESNSVGRVHTGFVFLVKCNSNSIKVRSELKSGELLTLEECSRFYTKMEKWSQITFNYLKKHSSNSLPHS